MYTSFDLSFWKRVFNIRARVIRSTSSGGPTATTFVYNAFSSGNHNIMRALLCMVAYQGVTNSTARKGQDEDR